MTLAKTSQLRSLNKSNGVTGQLNGKKEILRAREIFWQSRLLQPNGLNKRMG